MKIAKPMQAISSPIVKLRVIRNKNESSDNDKKITGASEAEKTKNAHEERIKTIKKRIENGSYYVDSCLIADKFLRSALSGFA